MKYFRTTPEAYSVLQPAIDDAFRAEWIDTGKCEHILPPQVEPWPDGKIYMALPDWMTQSEGAQGFIAHPSVEEINAEEFENARPKENL